MPLTPDARELLSLLAYVYLENNRPEKTAVVLNALRTLGLASPRVRSAFSTTAVFSGRLFSR